MTIPSSLIKKKANDLGIQKVGIAKATDTFIERERLETWLRRGNHAEMEWIKKRKNERGDIYSYFPEAKSVISVGINYYTGQSQDDLKSDYKFSNYAWGEDYHSVLKNKLIILSNWIQKLKPNSKSIVCVDTSPVMEKVWAQRAGIGWIGKHTNLISPDYGSWLFLGEIILDFKLEYDNPFDADLCGTCTACIDECPTQALTDYVLDSKKCISYLTIEHRGPFMEEDKGLEGWIYGCDICQDVCPWNKKFSQESEHGEFQARKEILNHNNKDWENISEDQFKSIFKNSAAKRTKYIGLKRNIINNMKKDV